jgi:predicted ATPase
MPYNPIQTLEIANYGCIRQARFDLSPLHCFVGPNDSGKSTLLRAARVAAQFAAGQIVMLNGHWAPLDPMFDTERDGTLITLHYADDLAYQLGTVDRSEPRLDGGAWPREIFERAFEGAEQARAERRRRNWQMPSILAEPGPVASQLRERITRATMVRFDPNALRLPSEQILAGQAVQFAQETGVGLASVYHAINGQDVDVFVRIRDRARELFPTLQTIQLIPEAGGKVSLRAKLTDQSEIPAAAMSEGLLYYLGYAALEHLQPSRLLLVEEPENGLHPARIAEVMTILREISKTSQVLIASHSPLVVNELQGHEVTIVTRDSERGTQGVLLKDVPDFDEATRIYAPGEFWLSYADGVREEPLLHGKPRA